MDLFKGHNPFRKRTAQQAMPTEADISILKEIAKLTEKRIETASRLAEDYQDDFDRITADINEILEYNSTLEDVGKNDFRLVNIPQTILDAYNKAKEALGIVGAGSKTTYRKERLREILKNGFVPNVDAEYMCHYPEDFDRKLDKKGNWIMILGDYAIENAPDKYSFHFATPKSRPHHLGDMKGSKAYRLWYASIICNNREVLMNPYEYIVVRDIDTILDSVDNGIKMIEGTASARLDKTKVFYLKSRGFSQAEVYRILFKSVKTKGVCHFQAEPELCEMYDLIQEGYRPTMAQKIVEHYKNLPTVKFKAV